MERSGRAGGVATTTAAFAGEAEQDVLDGELNEIAGHLNTQHARLVDATVELLAHPGRWQGDGVWTAAHYLCWRVGLAPNRARQIVEIAERVTELPICITAFGRGELTIDAMAAIAKRAPWWTDRKICGHGQTMTVTQLRRVLAGYPFPDIPNLADATDPVADDADSDDTGSDDTDSDDTGSSDDASDDTNSRDDVAAVGHCSFGWNDSGRFRLNVDTDATTGAIIEAALLEARDDLFNDGQGHVDWVDAIREICERSLDTVTETSRRDRFRINIHLDTDSAVDATGRRIPDAIRRHLTCDGLLAPVFVADGTPLSVGRSQRIVPERTRRQVMLRDQGCRVPGCHAHKFLEVHHIIHWEDLGPTDTWNLICLCPHHHRLHHRGKLAITGNADTPGGVTFTNPAGNPIAQYGAKPEKPGAPPPPTPGTYRHPLGERLHTKWISFTPPPEHRERAASP